MVVSAGRAGPVTSVRLCPGQVCRPHRAGVDRVCVPADGRHRRRTSEAGRWAALGHTGGPWAWRGWAGAQAPGGEALGRVQDSGSVPTQPGGSVGLGSVGPRRGDPGSLASPVPLLTRLSSLAEGPSLPSRPGASGLGRGAAFAWGEEEPPGRRLQRPPGARALLGLVRGWWGRRARPGHCQACAGPGLLRGSLQAPLRREAPGAGGHPPPSELLCAPVFPGPGPSAVPPQACPPARSAAPG